MSYSDDLTMIIKIILWVNFIKIIWVREGGSRVQIVQTGWPQLTIVLPPPHSRCWAQRCTRLLKDISNDTQFAGIVSVIFTIIPINVAHIWSPSWAQCKSHKTLCDENNMENYSNFIEKAKTMGEKRKKKCGNCIQILLKDGWVSWLPRECNFMELPCISMMWLHLKSIAILHAGKFFSPWNPVSIE